MLADISTAHTGTAEICFLIAVILAVLSAVGSFGANTLTKYAGTLLSLAVAAAALAWLLL